GTGDFLGRPIPNKISRSVTRSTVPVCVVFQRVAIEHQSIPRAVPTDDQGASVWLDPSGYGPGSGPNDCQPRRQVHVLRPRPDLVAGALTTVGTLTTCGRALPLCVGF